MAKTCVPVTDPRSRDCVFATINHNDGSLTFSRNFESLPDKLTIDAKWALQLRDFLNAGLDDLDEDGAM